MKKITKKSEEKSKRIKLFIIKVICIIEPIIFGINVILQAIKNNFIFSVLEKEKYNQYSIIFGTLFFTLGAILIFLLIFCSDEMRLFSPKKTIPKKIKVNNAFDYLNHFENELKAAKFKSGTFKSNKFHFRYYIKSEKNFVYL